MPEHACVWECCRVHRGLLCLWHGASSGEVALRFSERGFSLPLPSVAVRWQRPCRLDAKFKLCLSPALSQQSP